MARSDEPSGRRRLRWQPFALFAAVAMTLATIYLAYTRLHQSDEQKELYRYFRTTFVKLHAQTRSVQGAIAGLVGDDPPSPTKAIQLLDKNILPSIDYILEQCAAIRLEETEARALHLGYTQAVQGMRDDAVRMRAIFARPDLTLADQHNQVQAPIEQIGARFDKVNARTREVLQANGIKLTEPVDAGP